VNSRSPAPPLQTIGDGLALKPAILRRNAFAAGFLDLSCGVSVESCPGYIVARFFMHVLGAWANRLRMLVEPCKRWIGMVIAPTMAPPVRLEGRGTIDDQQTRAVQPTLIQIIEELAPCGGAFPAHIHDGQAITLLFHSRRTPMQPALRWFGGLLGRDASLMTWPSRISRMMSSIKPGYGAPHQASNNTFTLRPKPGLRTSLLTAPLNKRKQRTPSHPPRVRPASKPMRFSALCRLGQPGWYAAKKPLTPIR